MCFTVHALTSPSGFGVQSPVSFHTFSIYPSESFEKTDKLFLHTTLALEERVFLRHIAWLNSDGGDGIDMSQIAKVIEVVPEEARSMCTKLAQYAFIRLKGDKLFMHPLVKKFLHEVAALD